jgi:hypothetical protein
MPGEKFWSSCNRFCHSNLCLLLLAIFLSGLTVAGSGAGAVLVLDRALLVSKEQQADVANDLVQQTSLEKQNYVALINKLDGIEDEIEAVRSDVAIIKFRQDQADRAPSLGWIEQYLQDLAQQ